MKILKTVLLLLLIVFGLAQFFGPEHNEGSEVSFEAFLKDTDPPEDVRKILAGTCFDCHSEVTRYPWYARITPVNYWMAAHIEDGKKHFDISKWDDYAAKKKAHKLEELMELVQNREMPLPSYAWGHPEATLTEGQIQAVVDWAEMARFKYLLEKTPE